MNEHQHQAALFAWRDREQVNHPELAALYAIPNGGARSKRAGVYMKEEGLQAGVPDMHLPVARLVNGVLYYSLYIELKVGDNTPTPPQKQWHARLREQGNLVLTVWHWETAAETLIAYLTGGKLPDPQARRERRTKRARVKTPRHYVDFDVPAHLADVPF